MECPQRTKTRAAVCPAIPPLVIYLKEYISRHNKDNCTPVFIAALFLIAKLWKYTHALH
jgi:hypothetical protein